MSVGGGSKSDVVGCVNLLISVMPELDLGKWSDAILGLPGVNAEVVCSAMNYLSMVPQDKYELAFSQLGLAPMMDDLLAWLRVNGVAIGVAVNLSWVHETRASDRYWRMVENVSRSGICALDFTRLADSGLRVGSALARAVWVRAMLPEVVVSEDVPVDTAGVGRSPAAVVAVEIPAAVEPVVSVEKPVTNLECAGNCDGYESHASLKTGLVVKKDFTVLDVAIDDGSLELREWCVDVGGVDWRGKDPKLIESGRRMVGVVPAVDALATAMASGLSFSYDPGDISPKIADGRCYLDIMHDWGKAGALRILGNWPPLVELVSPGVLQFIDWGRARDHSVALDPFGVVHFVKGRSVLSVHAVLTMLLNRVKVKLKNPFDVGFVARVRVGGSLVSKLEVVEEGGCVADSGLVDYELGDQVEVHRGAVPWDELPVPSGLVVVAATVIERVRAECELEGLDVPVVLASEVQGKYYSHMWFVRYGCPGVTRLVSRYKLISKLSEFTMTYLDGPVVSGMDVQVRLWCRAGATGLGIVGV